jgi:PTH1 family peptidyl-tRNA hydrolase
LVLKAHRASRSLVAEGVLEDDAVCYCLPQTYMNLSGVAVAGIIARKKILLKNILVVHDDVALPLGALRFKVCGSDGGHNGLASVIERLATRDFARLRIGIGPKSELADLSDFVLSRFFREEKASSAEAIARAASAIRAWVRQGSPKCMNTYNAKSRKE